LNKEKEIETVTLMVRRYCWGVHGTRGEALGPILPTAVLFPAEPLRPPGYDKHNNVRCAVLLDSGVFSRSCS